MQEIYEILEDSKCVERFGTISVQYRNMDVEGLLYLLSCYFDIQFVATLYDGDLKSRIPCFELNDSTLQEALKELQRIFPYMKFRFFDRIVVLYDSSKVSFDQLRNPLEFLLVHHSSYTDEPVEIKLSDLLGYIAYYYHKSVILALDALDPETILKLRLAPDQRLGDISKVMHKALPGLSLDCFEDILSFSRKKPFIMIV